MSTSEALTRFDYGPVEFYAIAFSGDRPGPGVLQAVDDLVDAGTITLLDIVFVSRNDAGDLTVAELTETIEHDAVPALALRGLAGHEDIEEFAELVPPGMSAAILVVELVWAKAFAAALYDAGGAVVATRAIPAPVLNSFLTEYAE